MKMEPPKPAETGLPNKQVIRPEFIKTLLQDSARRLQQRQADGSRDVIMEQKVLQLLKEYFKMEL